MLSLPPVVTQAHAAQAAAGLRRAVSTAPVGVVVDASGLSEFDSSALAVLLACRREALEAGKGFAVSGVPERLRRLAGLYGVADLLAAPSSSPA